MEIYNLERNWAMAMALPRKACDKVSREELWKAVSEILPELASVSLEIEDVLPAAL